MKIPIEVDVFPDLNFCESEHGSTCCDYLDPAKAYDTTQCGLFRKDGKSIILRNLDRRETKCDKCKEEYQKQLKIGQECHFKCEKFGIPENSYLDDGKCKECIHTPPF